MKQQVIQTLHPEKGKRNMPVNAAQYELMKAAIVKVLQHSESTHTKLVDKLMQQLKVKFSGNISWYAMTVKLDLEARRIIKRTKSKPARYFIEQ